MKTMFLFVCMLCICSLGLAQSLTHDHNLKPGIIYVFQTPSGQWIAEGFPPNVDPYAITTINPAYLFPIDGSGPIPVNDPTLVKRINPYHNFNIDGIDPGPGPFKRKFINPAYLEPIDYIKPPVFDPTKIKTIDPAHLIWED